MEHGRRLRATRVAALLLAAAAELPAGPFIRVSAADGDPRLTPVERTLIKRHFGRRLPYHVSVSRSAEFPEVLRLTEYIDDVGAFPFAMIVDGAWIESGVDAQFAATIPLEATRRVLQARGWPTLGEAERKALALRWIEDALPPSFRSQTVAQGGHAPQVSIEDGDVIVRVWLVRTMTSIAGPRVTRNNFATVFRIKPDGSIGDSDSKDAPPRS